MPILIVEDDPEIGDLLTDFLTDAGYETVLVTDGLTACEQFSGQLYDLVLLDVLLPGLDGFSVCRRIRETSDVPIIMLTAVEDEHSQMAGFDLQIDDYITKPFSFSVLIRRIQAVLRRSGRKQPEILQCECLRLDPYGYTADMDGTRLPLTTREFEILRELILHRGRVLTRENLLEILWDGSVYGDPRTIDTHVKNLRRKLGKAADLIHTVRGIGYKIEADAT